MRFKIALFVTVISMLISITIAYGYSDPLSVTLIWQFLASALVGFAIFFKQIKFWLKNKFLKKKDEK
jgi:hypothetical protein